MKPSKFEYYSPLTLEEALRLLSDMGSDCKIIAGGQSLVPMMNMRRAEPEAIVDINGISRLVYIRSAGDSLRIGAMTSQGALEMSKIVEYKWPSLHKAIKCVAHPQIRTRGT